MERDKASQNPTFCIKPFERRVLAYSGHASPIPHNGSQPSPISCEVVRFAAAQVLPQVNETGCTGWELPKPITQTTITEVGTKGKLLEHFHNQHAQLSKLKRKLNVDGRTAVENHTVPIKVEGDNAVFPTFMLSRTLAYLDKLAHPPLLPARLADFFERDFRRVEAMFHTVFYRKYHPEVLADAKQQAFLGLYKKWLKKRSILQQSAAYIVTAAIYSVSNWRQKSQEVRANEGTLLIDSHGKIMGHTAVHGTERWTDRLDFQFDLANAAQVVLYQYEEDADYRETYAVMQDILDEVRFQQGQNALGLKRGQYMKRRNTLKNALREQLIDYATR